MPHKNRIVGFVPQGIVKSAGSGLKMAVVKSGMGGYGLGEQVLFILTSSGGLTDYINMSGDNVMSKGNRSENIVATINSEYTGGVEHKIVELSSRGSHLLCRMDDGALYTMNLEGSIVGVEHNVMRVTDHAIYRDKMEYFKSGPGSESLIPLMEDNIIDVYPQDGYDALLIVDKDDNCKVKIKMKDKVVVPDQVRPVAGVIGDTICYREGSKFKLEGGTINAEADDFGFIDIETPYHITIRSSCCELPLNDVGKGIDAIFPPLFAKHLKKEATIGQCQWTGYGPTGNVVESACDNKAGIRYEAKGQFPRIKRRVGYYVTGEKLHIFGEIDGVKIQNEVLMDVVLEGGIGATLNIGGTGKNFSEVVFHGVTFNYGGDRLVQMDTGAWQSLYSG